MPSPADRPDWGKVMVSCRTQIGQIGLHGANLQNTFCCQVSSTLATSSGVDASLHKTSRG